jgi:hypothetical protein
MSASNGRPSGAQQGDGLPGVALPDGVAAVPGDRVAAAGPAPGPDRPPEAADQVHVSFCPRCGAELDVQAFVQEYWTADARVFHCWCRACDFVCDVMPTERVVTHEPAHDD